MEDNGLHLRRPGGEPVFHAAQVDPEAGWTYDRFRREPEQLGVELVDGWMVREPAPTLEHQEVVARLHAAFVARLGEEAFTSALIAVNLVLAPDTVLQPDLCYVPAAHRARQAPREAVYGPPALVVEVVSAATRERDLVFKRRLYAEHRVPEYWAIDPEWACAYAFRAPAGSGYTRAQAVDASGRLVSSSLPGFAVGLAELLGCARHPGPWR